MRVNVGDFVLINYLDFNDEVSTGIFYVIYHECYDILGSQSFVGVKVSTKPSGFQVPINKEYLHFLNKNSYINCSSPHRFQEQQVIKILGRTNDYYLNRVIIQLNSFHKTIEKQLTDKVSSYLFTQSTREN